MRDDIRFLQELEADLETATRTREPRGNENSAERRRTIGRGIWAGVAAAVLVVSFALGSFVQGNDVQQAAVGAAAPSPQDAGAGSARPMPSAPGDEGLRYGALTDAPAPGAARTGMAGFDQSATWTAEQNATQGKSPEQTNAGLTDLSKIIRDGEMAVTIESGTFRDKATVVISIAHANGGSMLSSTTANGTSGTFTLRIPAARFDKAMLQLGALGSVDSSAVRGQDVTAEYIDQKAHLKIYLTHRKFLYGLMAKATTTGEALALENQLQQVQLKIDQTTGQLRYLNNQVAESTIKVDLHEPGSQPLTQASTVENPSLGEGFSRAVQGFLNVLYVMLIGFGYLIPVLVIAGVVFLVARLVQRRRNTIA
jgi:hypothetical protein